MVINSNPKWKFGCPITYTDITNMVFVIQSGRSRWRQVCVPLSQSKFFHFHAVFGQNFEKVIGWSNP